MNTPNLTLHGNSLLPQAMFQDSTLVSSGNFSSSIHRQGILNEANIMNGLPSVLSFMVESQKNSVLALMVDNIQRFKFGVSHCVGCLEVPCCG